jgi:hypothetical protein
VFVGVGVLVTFVGVTDGVMVCVGLGSGAPRDTIPLLIIYQFTISGDFGLYNEYCEKEFLGINYFQIL